MSDGPHRSLAMRKMWKEASKRLDSHAWSINDCSDYISDAVEQDFHRDIPEETLRAVRNILTENIQLSLMPDQVSKDLDQLRNRPGLSSFAMSLIDYADVSAQHTPLGQEALNQAIQSACLDRGGEGVRQIEEHWKRETGHARTQNVRHRAETALRSPQFQALGSRLGNANPIKSGTTTRPKHTGIDTGPELGQ